MGKKCDNGEVNTNLADRLYTLEQAVIQTFILGARVTGWLESANSMLRSLSLICQDIKEVHVNWAAFAACSEKRDDHVSLLLRNYQAVRVMMSNTPEISVWELSGSLTEVICQLVSAISHNSYLNNG